LRYEILIQKLRPDLLNKNMSKPISQPIVRPDVRNTEANVHQVAKDILLNNNVILDPTKPTALLDQFTGTVPLKGPSPAVSPKNNSGD